MGGSRCIRTLRAVGLVVRIGLERERGFGCNTAPSAANPLVMPSREPVCPETPSFFFFFLALRPRRPLVRDAVACIGKKQREGRRPTTCSPTHAPLLSYLSPPRHELEDCSCGRRLNTASGGGHASLCLLLVRRDSHFSQVPRLGHATAIPPVYRERQGNALGPMRVKNGGHLCLMANATQAFRFGPPKRAANSIGTGRACTLARC